MIPQAISNSESCKRLSVFRNMLISAEKKSTGDNWSKRKNHAYSMKNTVISSPQRTSYICALSSPRKTQNIRIFFSVCFGWKTDAIKVLFTSSSKMSKAWYSTICWWCVQATSMDFFFWGWQYARIDRKIITGYRNNQGA